MVCCSCLFALFGEWTGGVAREEKNLQKRKRKQFEERGESNGYLCMQAQRRAQIALEADIQYLFYS